MRLDEVRSALFLPASNPRAVAKARTLPCDLVILDLEDAVAAADKAAARAACVEAVQGDWSDRLLAVRLNALGSAWHAADLAMATALPLDLIVLPKVETVAALPDAGPPVLAMIETPAGLYAARAIAEDARVAGLLAGSNDLAAALRLPAAAGRAELALPLQMILLAARTAGVAALDGVFNGLDDMPAFEADCAASRLAGFDGRAVIHPRQIEPANRGYGPTAEECEEATALIAAFAGGAERFRGRMIEAMHVETARRMLARSGGAAEGAGL